MTDSLEKHAKAELDTIKSILNDNQYKFTHIHKKLEKIIDARINKETIIKNKKKWATFTYIACEIKTITKLLETQL
jgi:hypothetical protein